MKVGDYVRTKNGLIRKIVEIDKLIYIDKDYISDEPEYHNSLIEEDVIKSSPNLIDLIEVGDYVNGKKVIDKQYHYTDEDSRDIGEWCIFYENVALGDYQYDIKSIVTKEQFSSMEYKVGK